MANCRRPTVVLFTQQVVVVACVHRLGADDQMVSVLLYWRNIPITLIDAGRVARKCYLAIGQQLGVTAIFHHLSFAVGGHELVAMQRATATDRPDLFNFDAHSNCHFVIDSSKARGATSRSS
jgi:hypothetical protein